MELTQNILDNMMNIAISNVEKLGYKLPEFTWHLNKSTRCAGLCYYGRQNRIAISPIVAKYRTEHETMNTIYHEICHLLAPRDHHGKKWKNHASIVGRALGYDIERTFSFKTDEVKEIYRYHLVCQGCQSTSYRKKLTGGLKIIQEGGVYYRCKKCGSTHYKVVDTNNINPNNEQSNFVEGLRWVANSEYKGSQLTLEF